MTDIRTRGFKTKAELDEHLADIEKAAEAEGAMVPRVGQSAEEQETAELARLQDDLTSLRRRVALLREQAKTAISTRSHSADRSANQRLANYPWLKFAGIIAVTFLVATRYRSLPSSGMTAMPFAFLRSGKA